VTTQLPGNGGASDVVVQPDGQIVTSASAGAGTKDFYVLRYNTDGTLDSTFGVGGVARLAITADDDSTGAVALQRVPDSSQPGGSDLRILVGGRADTTKKGTPKTSFAVARFTSGGVPDGSFGTNGRVILDFSNPSVSHCRHRGAVGPQVCDGRPNKGEGRRPSRHRYALRARPHASVLRTSCSRNGRWRA
jgi:uncharacterized delta-60 repeat protein